MNGYISHCNDSFHFNDLRKLNCRTPLILFSFVWILLWVTDLYIDVTVWHCRRKRRWAFCVSKQQPLNTTLHCLHMSGSKSTGRSEKQQICFLSVSLSTLVYWNSTVELSLALTLKISQSSAQSMHTYTHTHIHTYIHTLYCWNASSVRWPHWSALWCEAHSCRLSRWYVNPTLRTRHTVSDSVGRRIARRRQTRSFLYSKVVTKCAACLTSSCPLQVHHPVVV
jgi:hypothetical protein